MLLVSTVTPLPDPLTVNAGEEAEEWGVKFCALPVKYSLPVPGVKVVAPEKSTFPEVASVELEKLNVPPVTLTAKQVSLRELPRSRPPA